MQQYNEGIQILLGRFNMFRLITSLALAGVVAFGVGLPVFLTDARSGEKQPAQSEDLRAELKSYRHKIVYESNRDGNFELYLCNADGSNPINLTKTKDVD